MGSVDRSVADGKSGRALHLFPDFLCTLTKQQSGVRYILCVTTDFLWFAFELISRCCRIGESTVTPIALRLPLVMVWCQLLAWRKNFFITVIATSPPSLPSAIIPGRRRLAGPAACCWYSWHNATQLVAALLTASATARRSWGTMYGTHARNRRSTYEDKMMRPDGTPDLYMLTTAAFFDERQLENGNDKPAITL